MENIILAIDEEDVTMHDMQEVILGEEEGIQLKNIIKDFVGSYIQNKDKPVQEWLEDKLKKELPEKSDEEIEKMTDSIIAGLKTAEEKKESLEKAENQGRSTESWFAAQMKKSGSAMSMTETVKYLDNLDSAVTKANEALHNTVMTSAGKINQNPNLDGFIAEDYHTETFNMNARARGSGYRAETLKPKDGTYTKNSVDIVIKDSDGKIVRKYQAKYYSNGKETSKAFEKGDYRGQRKLVPDNQQSEINKKVSNVIEAPDGTTSNPLTKDRAADMKREAQSGKWNDLNWDEYKIGDVAKGIANKAGMAAVYGAAIGAGFEMAQKTWNGEKIDGGEVVEKAVKTGADFGIKAAVSGALKVAVEKGIIKCIPKGTPAQVIANIVYIGVENVKVIYQMAVGKMTLKEGIDKMQQTTVAATAGLGGMFVGAEKGAMLGVVLGPVGAAVGGFVGGTLGYMAGSKTGETVVKTMQKVRDKVCDTVGELWETGKEFVGNVVETVRNKISEIGDFLFGWI